MKKRDIYVENEQSYVRQKEQRDLTFNGMSATEWALNSKSVWKDMPSMKVDSRIQGMDVLPNDLIDKIIYMYSKEEDKILDPLMGSGTTIISSIHNNRYCYGFEINKNRFLVAEDNILSSLNLLVNSGYEIYNEDALVGLDRIGDNSVQLVITSPSIPCLKNPKEDSDNLDELGYEDYLNKMDVLMDKLFRVTKNGGYAVFVVSDYRNIKAKEPYVELHADIAKCGKKAGFLYQDLIIYDHNDQRGLLLLGYPKVFYANLNHTYIVILRKAD
ncbi:MAG: DNA methyltransferase [Bacillales bacterium]|nr:DNA methyltransferase [Bacillales bacterium]